MVRTFIQGRVFAPTYSEAVQSITLSIENRGYDLVGEANPYPCPVQYQDDTIWWEYQVEVIIWPDR